MVKIHVCNNVLLDGNNIDTFYIMSRSTLADVFHFGRCANIEISSYNFITYTLTVTELRAKVPIK
jgi:hypothetical protein